MMKKLKIVSIFILVLMVVSISIYTLAENLDDLQNQKEEINEQIDSANLELEEIKSKMTATLRQIQDVDETIRSYESEIKELEAKEKELEISTNEAKAKYEIEESKYNKQKKLLEDRLIALYEAGETTYLDVLLDSNGLIDFISNYYLIAELAEYDTELLYSIEKDKNALEIQKDLLESQINQISST